MVENSYGILKRLDYVDEIIKTQKPRRVLDFGCGTGEILTVPLAERFPDVEFVGADDDTASIEFAIKKNVGMSNLAFVFPDDLDPSAKFDLIIASEVIEHVEHPEELLSFLKEKLADGGKLVITLPNGYGPFEICSMFESLLFRIGIDAPAIYKKLTSKTDDDGKYSLAISPHINFFSYSEICGLITGNGFDIGEYKARSFLCGVGFDQILRGRRLTGWNNRAADKLPSGAISGWMFCVGEGEAPPISPKVVYCRNRYARFRRRLNEKRWGITTQT